ncbi:MAG: hypothetical protein ACRDKE_00575 [Solirubrobacterales bacterium]
MTRETMAQPSREPRISWTRWAAIRDELAALETEILFEARRCTGRERELLDDAHSSIRNAIDEIELAGKFR